MFGIFTDQATNQNLDLRHPHSYEQRLSSASSNSFDPLAVLASLKAPTKLIKIEVPTERILEEIDPLTAKMKQAITQSSSSFKIVVLEKKQNNYNQIIVLAGETHIKSTKASAQGKELLRPFTVRGYEGFVANPKSIGDWALRIATWPLAITMKAISAMEDASFNPPINSSTIKHLEEPPSDPSSDKPLRFIHLEEGQAPITISGELSKVAFALPVIIPIIFFGLYIGKKIPKIKKTFEKVDKISSPVLLLFCYAGAAVAIVDLCFGRTKIPVLREAIAFRNHGILSMRNQHMVSNLERYLSNNPTSEPIINIVGKDHIPGMVEELEKAGWRQRVIK